MLKRVIGATLAALLSLVAYAQSGGLSRRIDGVSVYLGVVPSEIVRGHPSQHSESTMHGSAGRSTQLKHIVVALFDVKSGERITGASVSARVEQFGLTAESKDLEPMQISGAGSYGNFFRMPVKGHYKIHITVKLKESPHPLGTTFDYRD